MKEEENPIFSDYKHDISNLRFNKAITAIAIKLLL